MRGSVRFTTIVAICLVTLSAPAIGAPEGALKLGGISCDEIRVPASTPIAGTGPCPGVRPGAIVNSERGMCTFNFVFLGSDGARYAGTAGHCVLGESQLQSDAGEKSWRYGRGPRATDAGGKLVGYFVYAILQSPKDFALVRLARGVASSPSMCIFGGPTGMSTQNAGSAILHHFGNGLGIGDVVPARTEVTSDMSSPDHVFAAGVAAPGDSGSGVIDDAGKAVGVLVTVGVHSGDHPADNGVIGITRLGPQLARATRVLKVRFRLLTARLAS